MDTFIFIYSLETTLIQKDIPDLERRADPYHLKEITIQTQVFLYPPPF